MINLHIFKRPIPYGKSMKLAKLIAYITYAVIPIFKRALRSFANSK